MATVNYLIVAGGGSGGYSTNITGAVSSGGGGAGGVIETSADLAVGSYSVIVGAGGIAPTSQGPGADGGNSSFNGHTAIGGGGGGSAGSGNLNGRPGGSGGGGGSSGGVGGGSGVKGAGTIGQGNDGGDSFTANPRGAGGGGGKGGAGETPSTTGKGGDGGPGYTSSISGSNVTYAAGGGGSVTSGTAGVGGDASAGNGGLGSGNATSAAANSGSGGGGAQGGGAAGSGGSGIVIISYPDDGVITATGGTITTSGGNKIHTFTSSGTFEITSITTSYPVVESVTATDTINATVQYNVTVSESSTTTDTTSVSMSATVNEASFATDSVTTVAVFNATITEVDSAIDVTSAGNSGDVDETVTSSDVTDATGTYGISDTETINALDTVSVSVVYNVAIDEVANASDSTDYSGVSATVEIVTAADQVSATIVYSATITESASAQDSQRTPETYIGIIAEAGLPLDRQSYPAPPPTPTPTPGGTAINPNVKGLGPLDWRIPIVTPDGRPTSEFQRRWALQAANNSQIGGITLGAGPPPAIPAPADGAQYADTSTNPYTIYIASGGIWHLAGSPTITGANPTATASDVAVNGSANTFMRSDAAPAIQKASSSQFGIVKVDGTTITESGGVISAVGGGGGGALWETFDPSGGSTNTGSFGSRGGLVIPNANINVIALVARFTADPAVTYQGQICTVDGSDTVTAILATATLGPGLPTDSYGYHVFTFASPVALTAGNRYAFMFTRNTTSGSTSWTMRGTGTAGVLMNFGMTPITTYLRATVNNLTVGTSLASGANSYWWAMKAIPV